MELRPQSDLLQTQLGKVCQYHWNKSSAASWSTCSGDLSRARRCTCLSTTTSEISALQWYVYICNGMCICGSCEHSTHVAVRKRLPLPQTPPGVLDMWLCFGTKPNRQSNYRPLVLPCFLLCLLFMFAFCDL